MGRDRIVSLQILRFTAATMVVASHVFPTKTILPGAYVGAAGVDVFFILSGLVITLTGPLAATRPSGLEFFWNRWRRVAPIYFLFSIPFVAVAMADGRLNWPQTAATFLFWPAAGSSGVKPYLPVGWTLCLEMVFYSAVALLLVGGRLRRNLTFLTIAIVVLLLARAVWSTPPLLFLVDPLFLEFGVGVLLALSLDRLRAAPLGLGIGLLGGGMAIFAIEVLIQTARPEDYEGWLRVACFGVPAVMTVAGACICDRYVRGPLAKFFAWLGDASYSIYLTHLMFCWTALSLLPNIFGSHWIATSVTSVITALAGGALSYAFVEHPILRDLKRLRWPSPAMVPAE